MAFGLWSADRALGGATQPQGPHSRLEEVSPLIDAVEVKKGDPYLEVFITGHGHLDCYDVREFVVDRKADVTEIIPRLRRSSPDKPCKVKLQSFRDKAADLDPYARASYNIQVLGFRGWHPLSVPREGTPFR